MKAIGYLFVLLCTLTGSAFAADAGYNELAPYGQRLQLPVSFTVELCTPTACASPKYFPAPSNFLCDIPTLGTPAGGTAANSKCYAKEGNAIGIVPPVVAPVFVDRCLPEMRPDVWNMAYDTGDVPASISTEQPYFVTWLEAPACRTGDGFKADAFTAKDLETFIRRKFQTQAEFNAWVRTQTAVPRSPALKAFLVNQATAYAVKMTAANPVPVEAWAVKAIAAGTRPYYAPNTGMTGVKTPKLGDVAVGTLCTKTMRLGTTDYYFVESKNGYSVCAKK